MSALRAVEHHARVGHVEPDVQYNGVAVVSFSVLRVYPRLGQRQRQRLFPEHELLGGVFAVQQAAHHVSVITDGSIASVR